MLLVLKIASCYIGLNGFSLMSPLKACYLVGDCTSINTSHRPTQSTGKLELLLGNFSFEFQKGTWRTLYLQLLVGNFSYLTF
jgi:hypothetical protein